MTDSKHLTIISKEQAKALGLKKYFTGMPCRNGHIAERYIARNTGLRGGIDNGKTGKCIECMRENKKRLLENNPQIFKEIQIRHKLKNPIRWILRHAKYMAKHRKLEFCIAEHDFSGIPDFCPCCSIKMYVKYIGGQMPDTPTLDRVDNSKGYIKGNVAIICWKCNQIKNTGTSEEHRKIADWIDSFLAKKDPPV